MSEYQIGDQIIIRSDLKRCAEPPSVITDMLKYKGRVMTIDHITHDGWYKLKEDEDYYSWADYMIEGRVIDVDIERFESFLLE